MKFNIIFLSINVNLNETYYMKFHETSEIISPLEKPETSYPQT